VRGLGVYRALKVSRLKCVLASSMFAAKGLHTLIRILVDNSGLYSAL
jgi:hypothetical protein